MLRQLILVLLLLVPLAADNLRDERLWTGKNGKSFRGIFIRVIDNGARAEIAASSGQVYTIDIDNLVAGDRLLIRSSLAREEDVKKDDKKDPDAKAGEMEGFRKPPETPRNTIIAITPKAVGSRESDELLDPLWQFVGWWDIRGILPIPKKGDEEKRMEWAHERLARYCGVRGGNSVIRVEEAKEGLEEYFLEHHADDAAVGVHIDTDFNPERLALYCDGINAVVLCMTMTYGDNPKTYRACAALESIDAKGNAVMHFWGARKNVQIILEERRPDEPNWRRLSGANSSYRIVLADLDGLPDHIAQKGPVFKLDPQKYDTVLIARPYLFATPGQRRGLPEDPLFKPRTLRPGAPVEAKQAPAIPLPLDFSAALTAERNWQFKDRSSFEGRLSFENDRTAILRDSRGKTREVDVESLNPEDQAHYHFAHGCHGYGASPSRLQLHYRLKSQHGGTYDFHIYVQGTLARIECEETGRVLVFDLEDNAYHCWLGSTYRYHGRWSEVERHSGGLVPQAGRATIDEDEKRELFSHNVKVARKSADFIFPARFAQFRTDRDTFKNPKVDFTLMQDATAMVAIYQILHTSSPATKNPDNPKDPNRSLTIVFGNATEVGCHNGLSEIGHRFIRHHMLPLRMSWENKVNTSWVDRENQVKTAGKFEFTLVAAQVPESFPDDHFPIPEAARSAELGTCIRVTK